MTKANKSAAAKTANKSAAATAPTAGATQENSNANTGDDTTSGATAAGGTTQPTADGAADAKKATSKVKDQPVPKLLRQVVIEEMNFQTMKMEPKHVVREDDPTDLPESLTLFSMFGFFDENGQNHRGWSAGQVVTDPDEMRELIARGAVFQE